MTLKPFLLKKYILVFTLAVLSCANNSGTNNFAGSEIQQTESTADTYITCTIDGKAWRGDAEVLGFPMSNKIAVGGENDAWAIGINMPANTTAGQAVNAEANIVKKIKDAANIVFTNEIAAITIATKTAAAMEGSFSFTATNPNGKGTVKIENGKFKAKLIQR
jgi:hypothetical protein